MNKEVYKIIDNLCELADYVELQRLHLVELGFTKEDSRELIEHFVIENIKNKMEGK